MASSNKQGKTILINGNSYNDIEGLSGTITGTASADYIYGSSGSDTINGGAGNDVIRGGGGNDKLTGASGNDTFLFESSRSANGVDEITDLGVKRNGMVIENDILDLSLVLPKSSNVTGSTIGKYVQIKDGLLYVDTSGRGNFSGPWAQLDDLQSGDQVHIRTANFDGWVTSTASAALATPNAHLTTDSTDGGTGHNTDVVTNDGHITPPDNAVDATVEYRVSTDGGLNFSNWNSTYTPPSTDGSVDGNYIVQVHQYTTDPTTHFKNYSPTQTINFTLDTQADVDHDLGVTFADSSIDKTSATAQHEILNITGLDSDITHDATHVAITITDKNGHTTNALYDSANDQWYADVSGLDAGNLSADIHVTDYAGNETTVSGGSTTLSDSSGGGGGGGSSGITIFVAAGGAAFFDANGNGKFDLSDMGSANFAKFGEGGNVDLTSDTYTLHFIGWGGNDTSSVGGNAPVIDISGFGSDDAIIVDFSHAWAGTGFGASRTTSQIAFGSVQRGLTAHAFSGFNGYTLPSGFVPSPAASGPRQFSFTYPGSSGQAYYEYTKVEGTNISRTTHLVKYYLSYRTSNSSGQLDFWYSLPAGQVAGLSGYSMQHLAKWKISSWQATPNGGGSSVPISTLLGSQINVVWPDILA